jgi:hypothetical protein
MAEYNAEEAFDKQKQLLERVQRISDSIKRDVIDYYWDSYPETSEHNFQNEDGMRRYLKQAYQDIGDVLTLLEKEEGI